MAQSDETMCAEAEPVEITNPVLKALIEPGTPVPVQKFLYVVFFLLLCCSISLFWTELGIFHCCMVLFLSSGLICSVTWCANTPQPICLNDDQRPSVVIHAACRFLWEFRQENGVGVEGAASLGMGDEEATSTDAKKNE